MINANQITSRLRMMSDQDLQRFAEMHKQDPYMFPLAFNESNMRKEMRSAPQGQQQGAAQPPVNQQALASMQPAQLPEEQGIAALNPQMQFADGGLVAFAGGGEAHSGPYSQSDDMNFGTGGTYADGGDVRFADGGVLPFGARRALDASGNAQPFAARAMTPYGEYAGAKPLPADTSGQDALDALLDVRARKAAAGLDVRDIDAQIAAVKARQQVGPDISPAELGARNASASTAAGMLPGPQRDELAQGVANQTGAYQNDTNAVWAGMTRQESGQRQFDKQGNPITSLAGARGYAQLLPGTAKEAAGLAGVDWNPELFNQKRTGDPVKDEAARAYNERLGKAYFDKQLADFGNPAMAAAAYNMGPNGLRKTIAKYGDDWKSHIPDETKGYLASVFRRQDVAENVAKAGATPGAVSRSTPSAAPDAEGIAALTKQFDPVEDTRKLFADAEKAQAARDAEREKEYQANRPESESFKERKAALEEGRQDVDKQQRMNEGLAWLSFASRVVQPGKTAIQAIVEGAAVGAEQYSKAQGELKKAEKERKLGLAALAEAERAAERGDFDKQQARLDVSNNRFDGMQQAQIRAVAEAMNVKTKIAADVLQTQMQQEGAGERARINPQLDLLKALQADPALAALYGGKKDSVMADFSDYVKASPMLGIKPVEEQIAAFRAAQMILKGSQQPQLVASSTNPLTR